MSRSSKVPTPQAATRSSSTPGRTRAYHHGDLRRALLDAALAILRTEGLDALTLRAAARATGVSQTAPYRHFSDRTALLAGVAEDGFRRLRPRMQRAASAPPPPGSTARRTLQALAIEYFRFALDHPAEYRLMLGRELGSRPPESLPADLRDAQESVYAFLRGGIVRTQEMGLVRPGDAGTMAFTSWALLHGLVMLVLDGRMSKPGTLSAEEL